MTQTTKVTFDQIEPNIAEMDAEEDTVTVSWKCPVSGKLIGRSSARMTTGTDASVSEAKTAVTRTLIGAFVAFVVDTIAATFGTVAGNAARASSLSASQGLVKKATAVKYTEAMRQKAAVAAFKDVRSAFQWDEDRGLFVEAPATQ